MSEACSVRNTASNALVQRVGLAAADRRSNGILERDLWYVSRRKITLMGIIGKGLVTWQEEGRVKYQTYDLSTRLLSQIASDVSTFVTDAGNILFGVIEDNFGRGDEE